MLTGAQVMVKCLKPRASRLCSAILALRSVRFMTVYMIQVSGIFWFAMNRTADIWPADMPGDEEAGGLWATSGPGATNLITALATAYADSIPLIAITGQVSSELLGKDVFQEDITGSAEPFVKYSYLVRDAREIPRIFKEAFHCIYGTPRSGAD